MVHKAIHVRKGHIVAVKIISVGSLPKEEISSIEMEIKLMRCDLCASPSVCHCVSALVCLFLSYSAVHRDMSLPNIVEYIDSKLEGSELCIVLEYVEGGSLAKIMHDVGQGLSLSLSLSLCPRSRLSVCLPEIDVSAGTLPATLVALYLSKMLRGLVYLHSEGVIHRDVKAANILVDREGAWVLNAPLAAPFVCS